MSCAKIERQLREASDAYYNGTPVMEDWEFDAMWNAHKENRQTLPDDPTWADTILDRVGSPAADSGFKKVAHALPMLSLDNVFEAEDGNCDALTRWLDNIKRLYGGDVVVVAEPKIDGLSLELVYENGILQDAITRGDGVIGESVIQNVTPHMGIPLSIIPDRPWNGAGSYDHAVGTVYVRGEVYMPFTTFHDLNYALVDSGKKPMANPRNAAAGAIRLHDPNESIKRGLKFLAYNTSGWENESVTHSADMDRLAVLGFNVPARGQFATDNAPTVSEIRQSILQGLNFATDGLVFKIDHYQIQRGMGETSRAPRWAIAYKFQQPKVVTKLREITVQIGRTGALTPVGILEPVQVDGSVVSRVTLHNEDQVRRLGLLPGDDVEIRKAGAIIPEIVRSVSADYRRRELERHVASKYDTLTLEDQEAQVNEMLAAERTPFSLLKHIDHQCPACDSTDIERREEGASVYYCKNPDCGGRMESRIMHMCSRAALDIDGVGAEMSGAVAAEMGMRDIDDPLDLFRWEVGDLAEMTWTTESGGTMTFGMARAKKAKDALERAKTLPLNRWLVALGIHTVGVNTSKEISRLFKDAAELYTDSAYSWKWIHEIATNPKAKESPDIAPMQISHHLGPVSCASLIRFARSEAGTRTLQQLRRWEIKSDNYDPIPSAPAEGPLTGKSFCVTGTLSVPRDYIHELIKENGGNVVTGVSKKTNFLLLGEAGGSKVTKAEALGVPIITESEFRQMI